MAIMKKARVAVPGWRVEGAYCAWLWPRRICSCSLSYKIRSIPWKISVAVWNRHSSSMWLKTFDHNLKNLRNQK
jgi:hypothetical protein